MSYKKLPAKPHLQSRTIVNSDEQSQPHLKSCIESEIIFCPDKDGKRISSSGDTFECDV